MDTQNVSAQLYNKQLKEVPLNYNCSTYPGDSYLYTCVTQEDSESQVKASIESAFQQQLDLSEYYKSPVVFNKVKDEFMDRTMENENVPAVEMPVTKMVQVSQPVLEPVGPRDFLQKVIGSKSSFGKTTNILLFVVVLLAIFIGIYYYRKS